MLSSRSLFVTGGAGFIGGNFIRGWLANPSNGPVLNFDALTYAGNPSTLADMEVDARYRFVQGDIVYRERVEGLLKEYAPDAIVHFAAESHVDRSIHSPAAFIRSNIEGTFALLEAARSYWGLLEREAKTRFRFLHVSTDEVYGTLDEDAPPFNETTPYAPNSPYAASKAASDHLVRAWHHTYGLPVITTNCSNNYGPYQFPEKLIPLIITNALAGKELPIYGNGMQVRDWLYVGDHCAAINEVLANGKLGETYNIGGCNEQPNIEVVRTICRALDRLKPGKKPYEEKIAFVSDRPGHDRRYAIDAHKIERELNWKPVENFISGIEKTIRWYLDNPRWIADVQSGAYREWIAKQYT